MSIKLKTIQQFEKELFWEIDNIFAKYIKHYINTGLLLAEIEKRHSNRLIINSLYYDISNIYKHNYIHCYFDEYNLMNNILSEYGDYIYALPNKEFLKYMINYGSAPNFQEVNELIYKIFETYNDNIANQAINNCKKVSSFNQLAIFSDEINDNIIVETAHDRRYQQAVLYINGSILTAHMMHDELLKMYNKTYLHYKQEWIVDLNNVHMSLSVRDCTQLCIPCAKLLLYPYNICEMLVTYVGNPYKIAKSVSKRFHCKTYSFNSRINAFTRLGKSKY